MQTSLQNLATLATELQNNAPFIEAVNQAAALSIESLKNKGTLLICGNGGSATQASHMTGEIVGRFAYDRPALAAISLFDLATTTAIGNDYGYDHIFSRFIDGIGKQNDLLFCLSTSGNSGNCIKAIHSAKEKNIKVISLLGKDGGKMKELSDIAIVVPHNSTPLIQEIHLNIIHTLCKKIELSLFPETL